MTSTTSFRVKTERLTCREHTPPGRRQSPCRSQRPTSPSLSLQSETPPRPSRCSGNVYVGVGGTEVKEGGGRGRLVSLGPGLCSVGCRTRSGPKIWEGGEERPPGRGSVKTTPRRFSLPSSMTVENSDILGIVISN